LKIQVAGNGPFTYVWQKSSSPDGPYADVTPQDSPDCGAPQITSQGKIICGSHGPTLVIFKPSSDDGGWYQCKVTDSAGKSNNNPSHAQLTVKYNYEDGLGDSVKPDFQLEALNEMLGGPPPVHLTDWQSMLTWDEIQNPYSNGDNKAVIGAVLGLFYGPQFIIQNQWTGDKPVAVDYRCWLQGYLNQQNGGTNNAPSRFFEGSEFGSWDYTGWVDTAIAGAALYGEGGEHQNSLGWFEAQQKSPVTPAHACSFSPPSSSLGSLKAAAQQYLRTAVAFYVLTAGNSPKIANFVGASGQSSNRSPKVSAATLCEYVQW
jgi:hypothetical protein